MAAERPPEPGVSTRDGMTEAECRQALDELERYSLFARHARDIILVVRGDGRIIEANDAALRAYGYSHDELLSLTIYDLRAEWTIPDIRAQMERAEACGLLFETVHRRQDGSTFPVEVSASGASIGGERVLVSIIRDITERRDVVEAMREREREYRTLAENSPEVIARFDRRLRHTYINEYGAKVYGVSKEEVIGKANADLGMPPDKVAYWKEHLEEVLASGKQQTADFEFDSPTFGHQHFSSLFVPEFDEEGEVASVLAITRDITPIKKAEQALEAERSRLQTVLATLPVGVFIAEASGRIVEINDAGRRIWGQSAPMVGGDLPVRGV